MFKCKVKKVRRKMANFTNFLLTRAQAGVTHQHNTLGILIMKEKKHPKRPKNIEHLTVFHHWLQFLLNFFKPCTTFMSMTNSPEWLSWIKAPPSLRRDKKTTSKTSFSKQKKTEGGWSEKDVWKDKKYENEGEVREGGGGWKEFVW